MRDGPDTARTLCILGLALLVCLTAAAPSLAQSSGGTTTGSPGQGGLPLPRYVSLKSDRVNLRSGPGTDYPTTWVYRRAGLPLEVFEEFQNWRHVRDSEGTEGWIAGWLLSGRRTALVLPWDREKGASLPSITVHVDDSLSARPVAVVEAGVIADVHACDGTWCRISISAYRGYVEQKKLWGVYENETWK